MSNGANLDATDSGDVTALIRAAKKGHWKIVEVRCWLLIWLLLNEWKTFSTNFRIVAVSLYPCS